MDFLSMCGKFNYLTMDYPLYPYVLLSPSLDNFFTCMPMRFFYRMAGLWQSWTSMVGVCPRLHSDFYVCPWLKVLNIQPPPTHTHTHIHTHSYTHLRTHYVHAHLQIYTDTHKHTHTHIHTHTHWHTHTHTHTHTRTHTHTHTHAHHSTTHTHFHLAFCK